MPSPRDLSIAEKRFPFEFIHFTPFGMESLSSNLAIEASMSLTVNGETWLTFQCTPENKKELAVGYLFNQGDIQKMDEIVSMEICESGDNIDIWLDHSAVRPVNWIRNSGCHGGSTSKFRSDVPIEPKRSNKQLSIEQVFTLIATFLKNQTPHSESGGVHTTAFADGDTILFYFEDIGRHNTFDKIAGKILIENVQASTPSILTTGRVSSDMIQKAARIGTQFLISMRSPSAIGITLAEEWGITLLCSARKNRVNGFTHVNRIRI